MSKNQASFWDNLLNMPRIIRILTAGIFAITTTLAFTPFIDEIYLQFFFTPETRVLPSLISVGLGFLMYICGWIYLVGSAGTRPKVQTGLKLYLYAGLITLIIVVLWMISLLLTSL